MNTGKHNGYPVSPRPLQGFSLVELMIAMVIGLVLMAGVITIFLGGQQTYRMTDELSRIQENTRFAIDRVQQDGRMAGFRGGITFTITNHLDQNSPDYDVTLFDGPPVIGWEGSGTGPDDDHTISESTAGAGNWSNGDGIPLPDALDGNVITGNDVLLINRLRDTQCPLDGNPQPPATTINTDGSCGIPQDEIVVVAMDDLTGADFFQKTNAESAFTITRGGGQQPGNATPGADLLNHTDDSRVFVASSSAYYIGVGASGDLALFHRNLIGPNQVSEELISGVENMQILYGVNDGTNRRVIDYLPADQVSDWDSVGSVRLTLLLRSADRIRDDVDENIYNLLGTRVSVAEDRRVRKVATTTIAVRNRLD